MKMNLISFIYLMLLLVSCKTTTDVSHHGNANVKTYRVSGNITYSSDYCGGAYPSEAMLLQLANPTPYSGKVLFIRRTKTNDLSQPILYTLISDSLGNFSIDLPPGNYCLIDEFRKDRAIFEKVYSKDSTNYLRVPDPQCLDDWFNSCLYGFTVSDYSISTIQINIHRTCFRPEGIPCISYTGPMPP